MGLVKSGYRRSHKSTIAVISSAQDLTSYLFQITNNDKNFPKVLRYTLVTDIRNTCLTLNKSLAKATQIKAKHKKEWKQKLKHTMSARDAFIDLKTLLAISAKVANIKKPEHLAKLLTAVADDMSTWINHEKRINANLPSKKEYDKKHAEEIAWRKAWLSHPRDENGFMHLQWKHGNFIVEKI